MRLFIDARYTRLGHHDGISRYTASLLEALQALQAEGHPQLPDTFDLAMLISDPRQLAHLPQLPYYQVSSPTSALEPRVCQLINRYQPDLVFSPMQTIGLGGLGRNFKLILTLHDLIYYRHPTPPGFLPLPIRLGWRAFHQTYWPQRYLLNRADAVATVSQTTAGLIQAQQLTDRPLMLVPNAPAQQLATSSLQPASERTSRDLLYMGSFMPYKRVETLIQAMKFLPGYRLHLLSKAAPARLAELQAIAGESVIFHQGVSEADYRQLLSSSSALLTASLDEGYGLPVVEAQAAGCPVILSDIPIFREIAPSGLFASPDSAFSFAQAVLSLEDPQVRQTAIEGGLKDIRRFSWRQSALSLLAGAQQVLDQD